MSHKVKYVAPGDSLPGGERFLNKLFRLEHTQAARKGVVTRHFTEKLTHIVKSPNTNQTQKIKPKTNQRNVSPVVTVVSSLGKEPDVPLQNKEVKSQKPRTRSVSEARSEDKDREAWGQILLSNKSREKVSNFSNFDPLRTLHFLSKELHAKLKENDPENDDILQMVSDIQHALRRIPPEVSTLLHNPHVEYHSGDTSNYNPKTVATKTSQTPPTLYQEDTEKFQKIMEENTNRLEASCKQLEIVCNNLQSEKEMTERELDQARENVELLCKQVKELENEIEVMSTTKIAKLEEENRHLREELQKASLQANNMSSNEQHLKKVIEDMKKQKAISDENSAHMEYNMTLMKMEKEKFVTMLGIRDKEIKEIQEEMAKIQEQVNQQLRKLNGEVLQRANSMRTDPEPFIRAQASFCSEIGDTTISSIVTNETDNVGIKESPCGDGKTTRSRRESQDNVQEKLKVPSMDMYLQTDKEKDALDDLLAGLTPSLRSLLTSQNL